MITKNRASLLRLAAALEKHQRFSNSIGISVAFVTSPTQPSCIPLCEQAGGSRQNSRLSAGQSEIE
ncbi:hypothetical protein, partial [uncultured Adlercreutzia sp.]|uniref:hypothetical protein n=1 Tax=uncultured Adlercreutzia sp. TaxID=875803 RepID=UPI0026F37F01